MADSGLVERLVRARRFRIARELCLLVGPEIPAEVVVGSDFVLQHRGRGTVVHPRTKFGDGVRLFHNVTIGRADPHSYRVEASDLFFDIGDDVWLCPGSVLLCSAGTLRVGIGTVIGANSVLTRSTGDWEIWAGAPARRIGVRDPLYLPGERAGWAGPPEPVR